jgi:hypothetical protein
MITEALNYEDRLTLAIDFLIMRFEKRDNFLTDSDVLDAAEAYTTDDYTVLMSGDDWESADIADYESLRDDMFDHIEKMSEEGR